MKNKIKVLVFLIFIIILNCGCSKLSKKSNEGNDNSVNLYYSNEDTKTLSYISDLIRKYEEEEGVKINIIPVENTSELEKYVDYNKESSLMLLDGYDFIKFNSNGYLRDLSYLFKEESITQAFADISILYGVYEGKNYGLGLSPYSLDLVYNEDELNKFGIKVEKNDFGDLCKKLKEKNIKVPTFIKSEYSKELLLSALVANDTIIYDLYKTESTNELSKKIYSIKNGQKLFEVMHDLYNKGVLSEDMFVDSGEEIIDKFNKGEYPVILTTTLSANKIKSEGNNIGLVNKMSINNQEINAPVITDTILCTTVGAEKTDSVDKFFRYILNKDPFSDIAKKNYITGNRVADSNLKGVQIKMANSIISATEINEVYFDIIPNEYLKNISEESKNVLSGKYDSNEWNRIIEKNKSKS